MLEILGVRLLAPYVGLTLQTTTAIIGAVLAGIAAGAALGGRTADLVDPRRLLAWLLVGGGVLALLTVPVVRLLGPSLRGGGDAGALLLTFAALLPAAAVLSAVTPTLAKLQLRDLGSSGTVFGRLSAWATAGALAGTFLTGFVLVPRLAVTTSVIAVGAILVVTGLVPGCARSGARRGPARCWRAAGPPWRRRRATWSPTTTACASTATPSAPLAGSWCWTTCATRTWTWPTRAGSSSTTRAGSATRSPARRRRAVRWTPCSWAAAGSRCRAGWRPRGPARARACSRWTVTSSMLARDRLGLRTSPALRVLEGDARITMRDRRTRSADVVVGDAFGGRAVPWHLATTEWAREVRRVLRPGGLYALNVIDNGDLRLMRAEAATLLEVFADVRLVARPGPGRRQPGAAGLRSATARRRRAHGLVARARSGAGRWPGWQPAPSP